MVAIIFTKCLAPMYRQIFVQLSSVIRHSGSPVNRRSFSVILRKSSTDIFMGGTVYTTQYKVHLYCAYYATLKLAYRQAFTK